MILTLKRNCDDIFMPKMKYCYDDNDVGDDKKEVFFFFINDDGKNIVIVDADMKVMMPI